MTASVQLVGVYLVFTTLIIPALATRGIQHDRRRLFTGYNVSIVGYGVGLMLSALLADRNRYCFVAGCYRWFGGFH
jgi:zinc/manganese transport system permease protein